MRSLELERLGTAARWLRRSVRRTLAWTTLWAVSIPASALVAQDEARPSYIRYLPQPPQIVSQTSASATFHLYGDATRAEYVDRDPVDGIDDVRAGLLLRIAERFSPVLHRNGFLVPRSVWWVAGATPFMRVDRWIDSTRVGADSVQLDSNRVTRAAVGSFDTGNDAQLASLIRELDPDRVIPASVPAGARPSTVLFFDTPGSGERSWQRAYKDRGSSGSRVYAHFFVHEDSVPGLVERYTLVVQFIFFYPYNDGANNHEGDWEHINVLVGTLSSLTDVESVSPTGPTGRLTAAAVDAILDARTPLDSLAIARVDYYFHNLVLAVSYLPAVIAGHDERALPVPDSVSPFWEDHDFLRAAVDRRVHAGGGILATHPVGYIGGNNQGPDELLHLWPRFRGSYNRNSGATYPFPGTWQTIGPAKASETVRGPLVPPLIRDTTMPPQVGERIVIPDDEWVTYQAADIELLPDWERLIPLVRSDPLIRRHWAWFVLPARWGWPATRSPGGGAIPHTDLGDLAPFGPAFKVWWNRIEQDGEHIRFPFRALRTPMSPRVSWSVVQSGWGFLNIPLLVSQLYPFYNVLGAHLAPAGLPVADRFGIPVRRTFVGAGLERIATIGLGGTRTFGGDGFARTLLEVSDDPRVSAMRHDDTRLFGERMRFVSTTWPRVNLDLHLGKSVFIENSFAMGDASVTYSARNGDVDATLDGTLAMRQLTGGLRAGLPWPESESAASYARLGYGWTWYRAHNVRLDGVAIDGSFKGGYYPHFFPNRETWPNLAYAGLTYEYFGPRKQWIFDRLGYGLRFDGAFMLQRLPSHNRAATHDLWMRRGELSITGTIGW